jgi:hypothetical protein
MADVFISYSKVDSIDIAEFADELRANGFTVWWDNALIAGERFAEAILAELTAARAVIVIWSAASIQSDWVRSEATRALTRGILIPVRTEDINISQIPPPFDVLHTAMITDRAAIDAALLKLGLEPRSLSLTDLSVGHRFRTINLRTDKGWNEIYEALVGARSEQQSERGDVTRSIIATLRACDVRSAIVEYPYRDRDFTEEYAAVYSQEFPAGGNVCTLYHFLTVPAEDLDIIFTHKTPDERQRVNRLRSLSIGRAYAGFCVCRPIPDAPIGYTVIRCPWTSDAISRKLQAQHTAHIFGVEFHVDGFPFLESNTRMGTDTLAALWMVLRHLWAAESGPWRSLPTLLSVTRGELERLGEFPTPIHPSLDVSEIVRALHNADRYAHYFFALQSFEKGRPTFSWGDDTDPIAIVCEYIDSNIPVIILVTRKAEMSTSSGRMSEIKGFAVTGYGGATAPRRQRHRRPDAARPLNISRWVDRLWIQDGKAGPYVDLPVSPARPQGQSHDKLRTRSTFTCADIIGIIAPLPDKIFLPAGHAEIYAWEFVTAKAREWWLAFFKPDIAVEPKWLTAKDVVARTFLTKGYNHYVWLANADASLDLMTLASRLSYPRFVWITEFYCYSKDGLVDCSRSIAHVVADATSSKAVNLERYDTFLFGHSPGMAYALLETGVPGSTKFAAIEIVKDHSYSAFRLHERSEGQ